ncbi:MAG: hypothetical protein IPK39_21625 [Sulfuritalea sp.]|nr:hypothetical protein [Sulfuritalea sp.]
MFLTCKTRKKKDGKTHRYWSVVENRRRKGGGMVQRHVLYLGEINDAAASGSEIIDMLEGNSGAYQGDSDIPGRPASAGAGLRGWSRCAWTNCVWSDHDNGAPAGWRWSSGVGCNF